MAMSRRADDRDERRSIVNAHVRRRRAYRELRDSEGEIVVDEEGNPEYVSVASRIHPLYSPHEIVVGASFAGGARSFF